MYSNDPVSMGRSSATSDSMSESVSEAPEKLSYAARARLRRERKANSTLQLKGKSGTVERKENIYSPPPKASHTETELPSMAEEAEKSDAMELTSIDNSLQTSQDNLLAVETKEEKEVAKGYSREEEAKKRMELTDIDNSLQTSKDNLLAVETKEQKKVATVDSDEEEASL